MGLLIPIYKQTGSDKDPSNYRGITPLSSVGKLFTSILNGRLAAFAEQNDISGKIQTGFRKCYITVDHVFLFKCLIDLICKQRKKIMLCIY